MYVKMQESRPTHMKSDSASSGRTVKQCHTCPWRVGAQVEDIPNYVPELHKGLTTTIAKPGIPHLGEPLRVMACHYSKPGTDIPCAGWMHQQLGIGNNIALRLRVMR